MAAHVPGSTGEGEGTLPEARNAFLLGKEFECHECHSILIYPIVFSPGQVSEWIVHLVISQSGHAASRRAVLGCILRTAQESWNIGNFNGVMEILLGLRYVMKEEYPVRVQYAVYFVNGPKSILARGIHPFPAVLSWSALSYVFHLLIA